MGKFLCAKVIDENVKKLGLSAPIKMNILLSDIFLVLSSTQCT